jgi:hypothetical protein
MSSSTGITWTKTAGGTRVTRRDIFGTPVGRVEMASVYEGAGDVTGTPYRIQQHGPRRWVLTAPGMAGTVETRTLRDAKASARDREAFAADPGPGGDAAGIDTTPLHKATHSLNIGHHNAAAAHRARFVDEARDVLLAAAHYGQAAESFAEAARHYADADAHLSAAWCERRAAYMTRERDAARAAVEVTR